MLSGLIGEKTIYCHEHSREDLKRWADKNIILCPVCKKPYEYCHGLVNKPYFRHKDKTECEYLYSEPETEEHINGKIALFEWIRSQDKVSDAIMEGWLPQTKQRPDVMFKYNEKQYVIEYQCSPIATEYYERHNLYQAAGITDIWICGFEKYQKTAKRPKTMEVEAIGKFDSSTHIFVELKNCLDASQLPYGGLSLPKQLSNINLSDCVFTDRIVVNEKLHKPYIDDSIIRHNKFIEIQKEIEKRQVLVNNITNQLRRLEKLYSTVWHHCEFTYGDNNSDKYLVFFKFSSDIAETPSMFIKSDRIDMCEVENYKYPVKSGRKILSWRKGYRYNLIKTIPIVDINSPCEVYSKLHNYIVQIMQQGVIDYYKSKGGC